MFTHQVVTNISVSADFCSCVWTLICPPRYNYYCMHLKQCNYKMNTIHCLCEHYTMLLYSFEFATLHLLGAPMWCLCYLSSTYTTVCIWCYQIRRLYCSVHRYTTDLANSSSVFARLHSVFSYILQVIAEKTPSDGVADGNTVIPSSTFLDQSDKVSILWYY